MLGLSERQPNMLLAFNATPGILFYSGDKGLSLDQIVASGSLPPSFPMTVINDKFYWDGGIFDNTPLGAVLDGLDTSVGADRTIYVVNLFTNKAPVPHNMQEVTARTQNFQIANKTLEDVNMLGRINEVAVLMEALESLPEDNPLKERNLLPVVRRSSRFCGIVDKYPACYACSARTSVASNDTPGLRG